MRAPCMPQFIQRPNNPLFMEGPNMPQFIPSPNRPRVIHSVGQFLHRGPRRQRARSPGPVVQGALQWRGGTRRGGQRRGYLRVALLMTRTSLTPLPLIVHRGLYLRHSLPGVRSLLLCRRKISGQMCMFSCKLGVRSAVEHRSQEI